MKTLSKTLEEFEKIIDHYYINRLAMHEGHSYLHKIVDKTELNLFLSASLKELLEQERKNLLLEMKNIADRTENESLRQTVEQMAKNRGIIIN